MAWSFNARGKCETTNAPANLNKENPFVVATETIALGVALGNRFTSVIDFIPVDSEGKQLPFTVVSNTAGTNLSGSNSDQLYACWERNGTYFQVKNTLRDCNYAHDLNQGTSFRNIDNTVRVRHIDPSYVGQYPFYKIRVLQAGAEDSTKTVGFAIMLGIPEKGSWNLKK